VHVLIIYIYNFMVIVDLIFFTFSAGIVHVILSFTKTNIDAVINYYYYCIIDNIFFLNILEKNNNNTNKKKNDIIKNLESNY